MPRDPYLTATIGIAWITVVKQCVLRYHTLKSHCLAMGIPVPIVIVCTIV